MNRDDNDNAMKRSKDRKWFKRVRSSYIPITWQGGCIYVAYALYIMVVPIVWYTHERTLWNLLTGVIPLTIGAMLITQMIASKNAK